MVFATTRGKRGVRNKNTTVYCAALSKLGTGFHFCCFNCGHLSPISEHPVSLFTKSFSSTGEAKGPNYFLRSLRGILPGKTYPFWPDIMNRTELIRRLRLRLK